MGAKVGVGWRGAIGTTRVPDTLGGRGSVAHAVITLRRFWEVIGWHSSLWELLLMRDGAGEVRVGSTTRTRAVAYELRQREQSTAVAQPLTPAEPVGLSEAGGSSRGCLMCEATLGLPLAHTGPFSSCIQSRNPA